MIDWSSRIISHGPSTKKFLVQFPWLKMKD